MTTDHLIWAIFIVAPLIAVLIRAAHLSDKSNHARFLAETGVGLTPELRAYIDRKRETADCLIGY